MNVHQMNKCANMLQFPVNESKYKTQKMINACHFQVLYDQIIFLLWLATAAMDPQQNPWLLFVFDHYANIITYFLKHKLMLNFADSIVLST